MNGLHAALDELVTDVPEYGDLDRAIAQAEHERRRRYGVVASLVAAAAVLVVIAGTLALTRDQDAAPSPIAPTPTPTPSTTVQAPGPQDRPVEIADLGGALVLATLDQLDHPGTATLWRRESGRWQKLGTLEHAVPRHWKLDPDGISLSPGPGSQDVIATTSRDGGVTVSFSRDGGATWTSLAGPCAGCYIRLVGDAFYGSGAPVTTLWRAPFGATTWEELPLPPTPDPQSGSRRWFVMDDGTLVIEDSGDCVAGALGHYRVSRDEGETCSERRALPGSSNCIRGTCRNTLYAECGTTSCYYDTGGNGGGEGYYQSTDLVHWKPLQQPAPNLYPLTSPRVCPPSRGNDPVYDWVEEPALRVGGEVFRLFHVNDRDGREHVLKVSRDDCRTWRKALP